MCKNDSKPEFGVYLLSVSFKELQAQKLRGSGQLEIL